MFFLTYSNLFFIIVSRKKGFVFGTFGLGSKHQGLTVFRKSCFFSIYLRLYGMSISKMSQQFFKAAFTVGFVFNRISFEGTFFELFATVCANKAFWMEFFRHGSHTSTSNNFTTNKTNIGWHIRFINVHFFQKSSSEHFRHVFFFKWFF